MKAAIFCIGLALISFGLFLQQWQETAHLRHEVARLETAMKAMRLENAGLAASCAEGR